MVILSIKVFSNIVIFRRTPSNPDTRCQCNTPQIMDEYLDWELIKVFTLNEIQPTFKEKFLKCVNASLQPLQLKDIMKRYLVVTRKTVRTCGDIEKSAYEIVNQFDA